MIRALEPTPPGHRNPQKFQMGSMAAGIAANAEFKRNVSWWNAHAAEIVPQNLGKFVCIAGQELFVGDDAVEVTARAKAAHPRSSPMGLMCFQTSTYNGPMIYADRG